jgi:hypothetical protein
MPAKILIVTTDGKIVNLFANGDAEVYLREMNDGHAAARQVETTVRTTAEFDSLVAPRPGGRWDLPGQKEPDETKRHS